MTLQPISKCEKIDICDDTQKLALAQVLLISNASLVVAASKGHPLNRNFLTFSVEKILTPNSILLKKR